MCIIAYGLRGDMKQSQFEECLTNNPDGFFLLAYRNSEKKPYVYKRTLKRKEVEDEWERIDNDDSFILHARIKTHGSVSEKNIHGWFSDGWYFCHNGTLSIRSRGDMTDSETFFRDIFLPAFRDQQAIESLRKNNMIRAVIGTSKFVFFKEGRILSYGDFIKPHGKNVYFSNNSYMPVENQYIEIPNYLNCDSYKYKDTIHSINKNFEYWCF